MYPTAAISLPRLQAPARTSAARGRLASEAIELLVALFNPGKLVREVETMRKLYVESDRVAATDPVRAADLRARASRICLH